MLKKVLLLGTLLTSVLSQVIFECDFESTSDPDCGFTSDSFAEVQWTTNSGKTPSDATGPSVDHTLGTEQGNYKYYEASRVEPGSKAVLKTPKLAVEGGTVYCLTFWYHMFGAHIGSLSVAAEVNSDTLWTRSREGVAGIDEWKKAEISFSGSDRLQITGVKGGSDSGEPYGDIALDDFRITTGACGSPATTPASTPAPTPTPSTTTTTTRPPTTTTTTTTRPPTTTTRPTTTTTTTARPPSTTRAPVTTTTTRSTTTTTTRPPTTTTTRQTTTTTTRAPTPPRTPVPTSRLPITPPSTPAPTPPPTGTPVPPSVIPGEIMSCDVEAGQEGTPMLPCGLTQVTTDDFDWRVGSGATDSANTGPTMDKTKGAMGGGKYLYIDASSKVGGAKAALRMPISYSSSMGKQSCLTFWYHMYGRDIGSLSVTEYKVNTAREAWKTTGTQGDMWKMAEVGLFEGVTSVSFMATRGSTYEKDDAGDIAIDDIVLREGPCSFGPITSSTTTKSTTVSAAPSSGDENSLWGLEENIWIIILVCAGALVLILLVIICIQACALSNLRKSKVNLANDYSEIGYSTTHSRKSHQEYITAYDSVDAAESKRNSSNSANMGTSNPAYEVQPSNGSAYGSNPDMQNDASFHQY